MSKADEVIKFLNDVQTQFEEFCQRFNPGAQLEKNHGTALLVPFMFQYRGQMSLKKQALCTVTLRSILRLFLLKKWVGRVQK